MDKDIEYLISIIDTFGDFPFNPKCDCPQCLFLLERGWLESGKYTQKALDIYEREKGLLALEGE
jgi:hypothetical protein